MEIINYVLGYENLKIIQDSDSFRFSIDSTLLPNFVTIVSSMHRKTGCENRSCGIIFKAIAAVTFIKAEKSAFA